MVNNRTKGRNFENKTRADLETQSYIVDRWTNNVEFSGDLKSAKNIWGVTGVIVGKLVPARWNKFNSFTGFPDFMAFKHRKVIGEFVSPSEFIGVECKTNGYLTPLERAKCKWLLENEVFQKILIAKQGLKRGEIAYVEFKTD